MALSTPAGPVHASTAAYDSSDALGQLFRVMTK